MTGTGPSWTNMVYDAGVHMQLMYEADEHWTLLTAVEYAGSFYKALAAAALKADPSNKRRILLASITLTRPLVPVI
jgi:hypothetical protein